MTEELISLRGNLTSNYRLGKITNKYLVINLYAFAHYSREEVMKRMF